MVNTEENTSIDTPQSMTTLSAPSLLDHPVETKPERLPEEKATQSKRVKRRTVEEAIKKEDVSNKPQTMSIDDIDVPRANSQPKGARFNKGQRDYDWF